MSNVYKGNFQDWSDVQDNFNIGGDIRYMSEPAHVYAEYDCRDWAGEAQVVFSYDGEHWYLVDASHCSCYGLENQWDTEDFDPFLYMKALPKGKKIIASSDEIGFFRWLHANVK